MRKHSYNFVKNYLAERGILLKSKKYRGSKAKLTELVEAVVVGPNAQPYFHTLIKNLIIRYRLSATMEKSRLASLS